MRMLFSLLYLYIYITCFKYIMTVSFIIVSYFYFVMNLTQLEPSKRPVFFMFGHMILEHLKK
ncbi:hypothetical protein Hanom_Chr10g00907291 [Helianthus anomalus]